jgi:hypothetical protein
MTQEVSWPPQESQAGKTLTNLNEKVHMGRSQRQKMDLELKNFQGSTAHFSPNPFSKGECSVKVKNIFFMFCSQDVFSQGR